MMSDLEVTERLHRELTMIEAIDRLMAGEINRLYRERDRCEAQEWDTGDAVVEVRGEIAQVSAHRQRLVAARQQVQRELDVLDGSPMGQVGRH
ncbi:MAG: hypothetical protein IT307_15125 [Chloroflexi bacterium]|nr:hypothetical protein [Chloroflexota bacterium]